MLPISDREREVEHLRSLGASFRSIGETVGVSHERARAIYLRMLEKRRMNREIERNWRHLDKLCAKWGIDHKQEMRLIKLLKRNGINSIKDHRCGSADYLINLDGMGDTYVGMVVKAHKNDLFQKPR